MLEDLDGIEWNRLSHAHGVAADVPDQLRAVADADPGTAERALYDLYGSLWNDGRVYPATVAAVPFLAELAASEQVATARRVDVVVLLARIGASTHGDPDDRRRAGAALERARDRLRPLLDAGPAELRAAGAGLAAVFPSPARGWAGRLRELREAEADPMVRAHLAVAEALAEDRPPTRKDVEAAAAGDPYLSAWTEKRFEGLLGRRLSRGAAVELSLLLTELSLERV